MKKARFYWPRKNPMKELRLNLNEYQTALYLKENNIPFEQFKEELNTYHGDYKLWKTNHSAIKLLEEENIKLHSLESEIERLTNLIKEQKDKIIKAYTHFFQEKELLQQLITAHLEYKKAQEQKLPSVKLKKQKEKIYNELEEIVGEELMEEVEIILKDCEKLIHYETELQLAINNNQKLIDTKQQVINQITYNIQSINIDKGHTFIGNTQTGDNADFSYQIQEVLESKIQILPKN